MAVSKDNVFVITGQRAKAETQALAVEHFVACSTDRGSSMTLLSELVPGVQIIAVVALIDYEETLKKIRGVLAGGDKSLPVFVDPELKGDMRKENVFMATGQKCAGVDVAGETDCFVVCSQGREAARALLEGVVSHVQIQSIIGMVEYEEMLRKIRDVLAGVDQSWLVFVDPALEMAA
jgi:hypothetical protein